MPNCPMFRSGALGLGYLHLASMGNMRKLLVAYRRGQRHKSRGACCEFSAALVCGKSSVFSLRFDSRSESCQAMRMFRLSRKFVAVLLAIWFPLFSGNALAASISMQTMSGDCHTAQTGEHHSHHVSTAHQHMQHMQLAANQDQATEQHDQQNSPHDQQNFSHKNCGVCQLACNGYLATVAITVAEAQPSALSFTLYSMQLQSITSTPLDPPPLARA